MAKTIQNLKNEIASLQAQAEKRNKEIAQKNKRISELERNNEDQADKLVELQNALNAQVAAHTAEVSALTQAANAPAP